MSLETGAAPHSRSSEREGALDSWRNVRCANTGSPMTSEMLRQTSGFPAMPSLPQALSLPAERAIPPARIVSPEVASLLSIGWYQRCSLSGIFIRHSHSAHRIGSLPVRIDVESSRRSLALRNSRRSQKIPFSGPSAFVNHRDKSSSQPLPSESSFSTTHSLLVPGRHRLARSC